ncbi:hypothetical protein K443DRAFT_69610, partial [Laccaria amethystina LaAM-08-1]
VPPEDKTNKPLCRPLPVKVKPPPPKAPTPFVGLTQRMDRRLIRPRTYGCVGEEAGEYECGREDSAWKPTTPSAISPTTGSGGGGKNAMWAPP